MTQSTGTDVTFGGVWCNRVVAKQEDFHSAAPADQPISEEMFLQSLPFYYSTKQEYFHYVAPADQPINEEMLLQPFPFYYSTSRSTYK